MLVYPASGTVSGELLIQGRWEGGNLVPMVGEVRHLELRPG